MGIIAWLALLALQRKAIGARTCAMTTFRKDSKAPLYRQVYNLVQQHIFDGSWKPGQKVPSIQSAMEDYGVGRNTVINAYQQLVAEGYLEARHGVGHFVADVSLDALRRPDAATVLVPMKETLPGQSRSTLLCDLSYGNLAPGTFPAKTWSKLTVEVLLSVKNEYEFVSYGACFGDPGLRNEIARYLNASRDVGCTPEQVVLTSGIQDSISRVLKLFDPKKDVLCMEDPGFPGARTVAEDANFTLAYAPSDEGETAYLEAIDASRARLLYVTPSHQMPMGTHQSVDLRMRLLESALQTNAYILEDDYDSVYRFDSMPIPTLKSLDRWGRVIYMGTLSKTLSPSMRIGFLVLPHTLLEKYLKRFQTYRCTVSWLNQETLRLFIKRGHFERHIRKTERMAKERHDLLLKLFKEQMPASVQCVGTSAGLHMLMHVGNGMNQEELVASARENGVAIDSTRKYWHDPGNSPDDLVMIGYSGTRLEDIPRGVALLRKAWFE